jgi:type IV pilus assembly protein PilY1
MNSTRRHLMRPVSLAVLLALSGSATAEVVIPSVPLNAGQSNPPLVMMVAGKDHKQFYEAYNDTSDLDGDGRYDIRFNPKIEYYGLFDSKLCYEGKGVNTSGTLNSGTFNKNNDYFAPAAAVSNLETKTCTDSRWSGNFLNYLTTSRIDALRKVLYGGQRSVDTGITLLRRAYIPRDAHGWGKEYTSVAVDGYDITQYSPLTPPTNGRSHFLGSYTWLTSCATASTCRDASPVLAVALNATAGKHVWDWAAAEAGSLFNDGAVGATSKKYIVQVQACAGAYTLPPPDSTPNYRGDNCKPYTDAKGTTVFKPTGVLHKFGEDGSMLFGLLTGSYDNNLSGGVLRKVMSSFANEVDPATGKFTANATIVKTFDNLMIRGFEAGGAAEYKNFISGSAWVGGRLMKQGEFPDWGNPVGEMMYEALRYLGGAGMPVSAYVATTATIDGQVGLTRATWDKPYAANSAAHAPWCSKPNILVLSDINTSFDSDQLPGAKFKTCTTFTGTNLLTTDACNKLTGTSFTDNYFGPALNVGTLTHEIGEKEGINGHEYFIGQSDATVNWAPTAKPVSSLANIRGLAPEEPGKEGSYYSAAIAYYGKKEGITTQGSEKQKVDTYVVALASPLPKIEVPTAQGTVTIVPFGKSVVGSGYNINAGQNYFQPANQIVEFYIKSINLADPDNGGRYHAVFLISYEDMEQGADHDMDVIVEYDVKLTEAGKVEVKVTPTYQSAGIVLNVGYNVSGSTADGPHLVIQSRSDLGSPNYYLNVPDTRAVGWCNSTATGCTTLPTCTSNGTFGACNYTGNRTSTRTFTPQTNSTAAALLKAPLWYAAKWGGFRDKATDANHWPDVENKWDSQGTGTPDNYFLVRNALGLQKALESAFSSIKEGATSSGGVAVSSNTFGANDTLAFTTHYNPLDWSGELRAVKLLPISGTNPNGIGAEIWKASTHLPAAEHRKIFTRSDTAATTIPSTGKEFLWANLNPAQQTALTDNNTLVGQNVLNYIRGSAAQEISQGGKYRDRTRIDHAPSPLADSPSNTPYYVKDTKTVYLGANDGMLHAFDATNGQELFAYIPSALIPKLPALTRPGYAHAYYVDGEIAITTRAQAGGNYLVSALGRGGKGLFGLDVSDPANFTAAQVKWEINGAAPPAQCGTQPDLDNMGVVLGSPVIATLNDGNLYALVGNGYNSCYDRASLYIINIKTGTIARRLDLSNGSGGLSTPAVLDKDGDGKADIAYAGDLQGQLWRFDLSAPDPGDWSISFGGTNKPMFAAKNSSGTAQPITAPPTIAINDAVIPAQTFVIFGTGRYISPSDKSDQQIQSWYGLIDSGNNSITRSELIERKFNASGSGTLPDGTATSLRAVEQQTDLGDINNKRGWYIDFNLAGDKGERVVSSALIVHAPQGTVAEIPSIIPVDNDPCAAGGRGYINFVNAFTGSRVEFAFMDITGDGIVDSKDVMADGKYPSSIDLQVGMPGNLNLVSAQNVTSGTNGKISSVAKGLGDPRHRGRVSWREITHE